MDKTVGIIGLGIMGGAIARNLVARGWRVIGFDTDPAKCAELAEADVVIVENVAHVVKNAPIVMTSLPTPAAVESVAKAIADSGQPPRIVAELSTLTLADKLRFEAILKKAGHIALDCPLSGTGAQAKLRDLIVYASGDSAAIAKCVPLFADFGKQSADLGAYGNGSKMKFVANHLVAIHNVATAEAMILAERAGLDPEKGHGDHRRIRRRRRRRDPDVHADPACLYAGPDHGARRSGHGFRVRSPEEDPRHRSQRRQQGRQIGPGAE